MADDEKPTSSQRDAPPSVKRNSFCCPHCGAFTHQDWFGLYAIELAEGQVPWIPDEVDLARLAKELDLNTQQREIWAERIARYAAGTIFFEETKPKFSELDVANLYLSKCYTCHEIAVWVHDRLLFPPSRTGPAPNADLPAGIKAVYEEARSILSLSPRAAAALLRVCVEMLATHLAAKGGTLDAKIADLVANGLNKSLQQALDAVRVIGNEAVHPGQMDLNDNPDTAEALFKLVNVIAEKMISEPKHVQEIYGLLPPGKREAIEKRDKKGE